MASRIKKFMKTIKDVCVNSAERLYIANSFEITKLINQLSMNKFYPILNFQSHHERSTIMVPKFGPDIPKKENNIRLSTPDRRVTAAILS